MADIQSKQDLINAGYKGYMGWGETEALADYRATGGQGKYDPGTSGASSVSSVSGVSNMVKPPLATQSFQDYLNQAQQMYQQTTQPAISSFQSMVPEVKSTIANKTQLLNERYANTINEIKSGQKKAETSQTRVTAGELGKRGIDPTSTLYGQELTSAINPITESYTGLLKGAATEQAGAEQKLADIETTKLRDIANAIAQLQSGTGQNAAALASQLYGTDISAGQSAAQIALQQAQLAEQKRQADIVNALKQKIYETIQLPESQYAINKPYFKPETPASTASIDRYYTPSKTSVNRYEFVS